MEALMHQLGYDIPEVTNLKMMAIHKFKDKLHFDMSQFEDLDPVLEIFSRNSKTNYTLESAPYELDILEDFENCTLRLNMAQQLQRITLLLL